MRVLIIAGVFLSGAVILTWLGSRRHGIRGMVGVHILLTVAYLVMAGIALEFGQYEYDGVLSLVGLLLQSFLLNCLLLPVAFIALWQRRRAIQLGKRARQHV